MLAPSPRSVRFVCRSAVARARPPAPPFGVSGWVDDGEATVVQLDASEGDLTITEAVASQIPDSGTFAERTLVVVLGRAAGRGGAWRRLLFLGEASMSRAARCSALLMRGYVDIAAGMDAKTSQDLAWGWSQRG
jgi:hypothetical protein